MSSRRSVTGPYFPFYVQDYLVGTIGMSLAAQGLYVRLLCFQWHSVHVLKDFAKLAIWLGCSLKEFESLWPEVRPKFIETPHGFYNKRLRRERGEYAVKVEQRRQAGKRSGEVRRKQPPLELAAPPPSDLAASQAEYAENPPETEPIWRVPQGGGIEADARTTRALPVGASERTVEDSAAVRRDGRSDLRVSSNLAPATNPHHKPTNLINGASLRRHGSHAWCSPRDGLCVPQFLHEEFLGKSNKPPDELLAWYASSIAALNGHAVGEDALVFWRNTFAGWVGTVTASPDTSSRQARNNADARKTLTEIRDGTRKSITQVVRELAARPAIAAKPS